MRVTSAVVLLWLALASGTLLWRPCHSQALYPDIPTHAHPSATAQGWTCNDNFRQVAGFCVLDDRDAPSQTIPEVFDGQWRCLSGYQRVNVFCVLPTAPAHASLVGSGGRWECDWGFRKVGARCEEVVPPAHAYLDAAGDDWLCFPGFERESDHCVPASNAPLAPEKGTSGQ